MFTINNFWIGFSRYLGIGHVVTQLIGHCHDDAEGFTFIMVFQLLNIFQHKNRWLMGLPTLNSYPLACLRNDRRDDEQMHLVQVNNDILRLSVALHVLAVQIQKWLCDSGIGMVSTVIFFPTKVYGSGQSLNVTYQRAVFGCKLTFLAAIFVPRRQKPRAAK